MITGADFSLGSDGFNSTNQDQDPPGQDKDIEKCLEIPAADRQPQAELKEQETAAETIAQEQERLMKLIPSGHGEQAVAWRTDLADAEKQLREIKRSKIPTLKSQLREAESELHKALRACNTNGRMEPGPRAREPSEHQRHDGISTSQYPQHTEAAAWLPNPSLLGDLRGGQLYSYAFGTSNDGTVVGLGTVSTGHEAFVNSSGTTTGLAPNGILPFGLKLEIERNYTSATGCQRSQSWRYNPMAKDGETFEQWLDRAKSPAISFAATTCRLGGGVCFLQRAGSDYAQPTHRGHFC